MVEAVSYTGSRGPVGGSGGAEAKEEKARSCAVAHAPAGEHSSTSVHVARAGHSLFGYLELYPIR